jgi:hypothetical protein
VTADWDAYVWPYFPGGFGYVHAYPFQTLSRPEARRAYDELMAGKEERLDNLRRLVRGEGIELDESLPSIQQLNDWFRNNVEREAELSAVPGGPWRQVVDDVALFLGDVVIGRNSGVDWALWTRRPTQDIGYHRPVLVGFDVPHTESYCVYIYFLVSSYAIQVLQARILSSRRERFVELVTEIGALPPCPRQQVETSE